MFPIFLKANTFAKTERKKLRIFLLNKFEKLSQVPNSFSSYLAGLFLPVSAYDNEEKCKQRSLERLTHYLTFGPYYN